MCPRHPRSSLFPYTTLFRSPHRWWAETIPHHVARFTHIRAPRLGRHGNLRSSLVHRRPSSRSEEHTSELQSRFDLVCRLLLEKKNTVVLFDIATLYTSRFIL